MRKIIRRATTLLFLLVLALGLLASGCGGDEDDEITVPPIPEIEDVDPPE